MTILTLPVAITHRTSPLLREAYLRSRLHHEVAVPFHALRHLGDRDAVLGVDRDDLTGQLEYVAERDGGGEADLVLAKVLYAEPVGEPGGEQPGLQLAHGDDRAEPGGPGEAGVVVQRVEVAAGTGEADDVGLGDRADLTDRAGVARARFRRWPHGARSIRTSRWRMATAPVGRRTRSRG